MDLTLVANHGDDTRSWTVYSSNPFTIGEGFTEVKPGLYKLSLPEVKDYPYSAYEQNMYCMYMGYKYYVENIFDGVFILYPQERQTRRYLNLHAYDDSRLHIPYNEFIRSHPTIWVERTPIDGFRFDVESTDYLIRDGAWLVDGPLSPMSSVSSEEKKDKLVYLGLSNARAKEVPPPPKRKQAEAVDNSEATHEVVEENAYDILLEKVGGIVITLLVIGAFLLIAYFFDRCV